MPSAKPVSTAASVTGALLAVVCLFLLVFVVGALSDLNGGDAAGTAMAQGFTAIGIFLLYVPLAVLALVAAIWGDMAPSGRVALFVLVPASLGAISITFTLLEKPQLPPGLWPLAIPAWAPTLIVLYCLWALIPPLRARVPPLAAAVVVWGGVGMLCLAAWPLSMVRDQVDQREAARVADWQAKFDAIPADAPLAQWLPFLASDVYLIEQAAGEAMRKLPRRQGDAEAMLDRDELPFDKLDQLDLDPTPALCDKARASLTRRAAALASPSGPPHSAQEMFDEVDAAARAMAWLVGFACPCEQESLAWEALARSHGVPDSTLLDLAKLRDPGELGRTLYNSPPRFSMLTPKAKLGAWLEFAWDPAAPAGRIEAAVAGARKLDHRTADAVEWLTDPYRKTDAFELMRYLPELDLEATPELCAAGLSWVREEIAGTYRPSADNPLPYSQLPDRLGAGDPLAALQWLASHGCGAEAELAAAERLIEGYGEATGRAAMLQSLAALHRKP
jgi:hypothetical protein